MRGKRVRFRVKDMDIATGGILVALLNEKDAEKYDIHALDRIKIRKGKKTETVVVDIGESRRAVPEGKIGIFEEVLSSLGVKGGSIVTIVLARKPLSLEYIRKKMDGGELDRREIDQIVWDIVHNKLDNVEMAYFISACYMRSMTMKETTMLTKAMKEHGDILNLKKYPVMDKHCIGGVAGNRTTMIIVPILAAAGLTMPKTSSRSISSPAGTADTMEVLANVCISIRKMENIVKKVGACITWGGALNLAPADDKLIKVERPLMIDAKSQLLSSVMAKKASVSATHVLVDLPWGRGAKINSIKRARALKRDFEMIGKNLGMKTKVILTDGSQPIGHGIGPCLEARDVLWVLKNDPKQPYDLRKKAVMMAGLMLEMSGKKKKGHGRQMAEEILESGKAYRKMVEIINAQRKKITEPDKIPVGKVSHDVPAWKKGKISRISNEAISKIARVAGAPKDKEAGIYLYRHVGDPVKKGDTILTIYSMSKERLGYARQILADWDGIVIK